MDNTNNNECCLNEDALIAIFSKLTVRERIKIESVCKKWKKLSFVGVKKLTFVFSSDCNDQDDYDEEQWTLPVCNSDQILETLAKCKCIESITLIKWLLCSETLKRCEEISEHLTDVKNLKFIDSNIGDENIISMIKNCCRIEQLSFDCCSDISVAVYDAIFENCDQLKHLLVNDSGELTIRCLQKMTQQLKSFQYSHYKRFTFSPSTVETSADALDVILKNSGQSLERLILPRVNYSCFRFICDFKNLQYLKVTLSFKDEHWWNLISWSQLKVLDLCVEESRIDDCGFESLISKCSSLRQLALRWLSFGKLAITDKSVKVMSETCDNLNVLIITGAFKITDESVPFLLKFRNLEILQLQHCDSVTDKGLASFVKSSKCIRVLGIKCSTHFCQTIDTMHQKAVKHKQCEFYQFCHFQCGCNTHSFKSLHLPINFHLYVHVNDPHQSTTAQIRQSFQCLKFFSAHSDSILELKRHLNNKHVNTSLLTDKQTLA